TPLPDKVIGLQVNDVFVSMEHVSRGPKDLLFKLIEFDDVTNRMRWFELRERWRSFKEPDFEDPDMLDQLARVFPKWNETTRVKFLEQNQERAEVVEDFIGSSLVLTAYWSVPQRFDWYRSQDVMHVWQVCTGNNLIMFDTSTTWCESPEVILKEVFF